MRTPVPPVVPSGPVPSGRLARALAPRTSSQVPPHPPVPLPPQPFAGMPASPCTSQRPVSSSVPRRLAFRTCTSAALLSLIAVFALSASPAFAARARVFTRSFGCEAGVAGCTVPDRYPLAAEPWSTAVNEATGDVYVTDALNYRVEEFNSHGEFVLMFGRKVNMTAVLAAGSEAEQNLCTAVSLDTCQPGEASSTPGGFDGELLFVAVDNSGGVSGGDVYVGDFAEHGTGNRVSKFSSSGQLVSAWGSGGELVAQGGPIEGVAVDPSGNMWVGGEQATFEYGQEGAVKTHWVTPVHAPPFGVAVDAQDNLYFIAGGKVVEVSSGAAKSARSAKPAKKNMSWNRMVLRWILRATACLFLMKWETLRRSVCSCSVMCRNRGARRRAKGRVVWRRKRL